MTSVALVNHPITKKVPFGEKIVVTAMGDCLVASKIGLAVSDQPIGASFDWGAAKVVFTSKGLLNIYDSGGWIITASFVPPRSGKYYATAIPICIPTGPGATGATDFEVVPRESKILPDLSVKGVLNFLDLKLGLRVGEPIPIQGKIKFSDILADFIASVQPEIGGLTMHAEIFKDGTPTGEIIDFTTRADGSFITAYTPKDAGYYKIVITLDPTINTTGDVYDFSGKARKVPTAIVAEKAYVGKLKPYSDPGYKGTETIEVSGRLITGEYEESGSLKEVTAGIPAKQIVIKANDMPVMKIPTNADGSFTYQITGNNLASLLSVDLQKMLENKLVKFTAEFEGDGTYTPAEGETRIYLRGIYITLKVSVSMVQKLLDRVKYGEELKIEGLLTKMTLGAPDETVRIVVRQEDGAGILSTTAMTDSIGSFSLKFKVAGAPVGKNGTYTIEASYVDPDFGVTVKDTETIDIEKWLTKMNVNDTFLKLISAQKLPVDTKNQITGAVEYTEKTSGAIGMKVKLYELADIDTKFTLQKIIDRIVQAGQNYSESLIDEVRAAQTFLAQMTPVAEADSLIGGAFTLNYIPTKLGKITLVASNFEDTTRYGSFQSFDVEVGPADVNISFAADKRNVRFPGNAAAFTGRVTSKITPDTGIATKITLFYYVSPKAGTMIKMVENLATDAEGNFKYQWKPTKAGFYVVHAEHIAEPKLGQASSPATTVAYYEVDADGKWICPFDGRKFDTEAELIEHLNEHHSGYDDVTKGCDYWRPYVVGNLIKYTWCRTKQRFGIE